MKDILKNYYISLAPVDVLVAVHCIVMMFLLAVRGRYAFDTAVYYLPRYSLVLAAAVIVAPAADRVRHPAVQNPLIRFLRNIYPIFLLAPFFRWTYPISYMFFPTPFDDYLLQADIVLFRFNIARDLVHRWGDNYWLTEWMNFSYLSYYWVTLYLPIYLYIKKQYRDFHYVVFVSGMTIFSCFIFQAVFPAQGPIHYDPALHEYLKAGPVSEFARLFLIRMDIPGGAIPSGHIAGALVILLLAWRFARRAFWITLPVVASLCISTVYCRYHYAIDGIAGLFVALIAVYLVGPKLFARLFPHLSQENETLYKEITVPA